jgi:putative addiction module component (TIGR02574 family)
MSTVTPEMIEALKPAERLELLERLWDSLSDDEVPLTDAQKAELDRRLEDLDRNPEDSEPWEAVRDRLQRRLK